MALVASLGEVQHGIDEACSAADRLMPRLDLKGGSDDTALVMPFDVGGGYNTTVDIDLKMRMTLVAIHDQNPLC